MMKQFFLLLVLGVLSGCSAVYSTAPVGMQPKNIENSQEEWSGTWLHAEGAVTVRVVDGANGELEVGWVEEKLGALKCETYAMHLREVGDWTFASFKPLGAPREDHYVWARIRKEERMAILWPPDVEKFEALVQEGRLPGTVDGHVVVLDGLTPAHCEVLQSETNGVLYVWDKPLVLIKAGK